MRHAILAIIYISVLVVALGAPPPKVITPDAWELVREDKAARLEVEDSAISPALSQNDRQAILKITARLKGVHPKVRRIDACWEDFAVAARVHVGDLEAYFTRGESKNWCLIHVVRIVR